ncbi:cell envelope integrity protein CreD [Oleidesulfovibrio sp.]|uniref:cell envelope integrity protein CreD n=1 Tax=Oleidesulfovibrio sp. TaxID=2909707 RepID=UPI003A866DE2
MKGYWRKILIITALSLGSIIPLGLVDGVITEREYLQQDVAAQIARQHGGNQSLTSPLIVVEYVVEEVVVTKEYDEKRFLWTERREDKRTNGVFSFAPRSTKVEGTLDPKLLHRGTFSVPVYSSTLHFSGTFSGITLPEIGQKIRNGRIVEVATPMLIVPMARPGGITQRPTLKINNIGKSVQPLRGKFSTLPPGFASNLSPEELEDGSIAFSVELPVQGSEMLSFVPQGSEFTVFLQSSWPHPTFNGSFLPVDREVTDEGFKAHWFVTDLAGNTVVKLSDLFRHNYTNFSVGLIEPVDVYRQAERAVKYGFLFTLLTLEFFLLFDLLKGLKIHVAQYSLVAGALIIFYLLLVSLAEHIGFSLAYLAASGSCIAILVCYLRTVVKNGRLVTIFGFAIAVLYGVLYCILLSEQYALLMGSGLLFAVLAGTMLLTRNVDWYALEAKVAIPALRDKQKKPDKQRKLSDQKKSEELQK